MSLATMGGLAILGTLILAPLTVTVRHRNGQRTRRALDAARVESRRLGFDEGHQIGHDFGKALGRAEGLEKGRREGAYKGEADGYRNGYADGRKAGFADALRQVRERVEAITDRAD